MINVTVTGAEEIQKNLKLAQDDVKNNVLRGMINAARLVRSDMEASIPATPVDWGNLRSSFFITTVLGNQQVRTAYKGPNAARVMADTSAAMTAALAEVKGAKKMTLIMGYGANYAIWVHEMHQVTNWTRKSPLSGPKWFEISLKKKKADMFKMIGIAAKITTVKHYTDTKIDSARTDIGEI